jgi:predicted TIM-barrel fold metal-dependent hydrolase
MKECPNVYADTAAVWRLLWNEEMVSIIRDNNMFGQVLFGTDYPMPVFLSGSEKGVVDSILNNNLLTEKEKQQLLSSNALHLLDDCRRM